MHMAYITITGCLKYHSNSVYVAEQQTKPVIKAPFSKLEITRTCRFPVCAIIFGGLVAEVLTAVLSTLWMSSTVNHACRVVPSAE